MPDTFVMDCDWIDCVVRYIILCQRDTWFMCCSYFLWYKHLLKCSYFLLVLISYVFFLVFGVFFFINLKPLLSRFPHFFKFWYFFDWCNMSAFFSCKAHLDSVYLIKSRVLKYFNVPVFFWSLVHLWQVGLLWCDYGRRESRVVSHDKTRMSTVTSPT